MQLQHVNPLFLFQKTLLVLVPRPGARKASLNQILILRHQSGLHPKMMRKSSPSFWGIQFTGPMKSSHLSLKPLSTWYLQPGCNGHERDILPYQIDILFLLRSQASWKKLLILRVVCLLVARLCLWGKWHQKIWHAWLPTSYLPYICLTSSFFKVLEVWNVVVVKDNAIEDRQFPGGRQTAPKLPLALANTTKSSTRVTRLS